MRGREPAYRQQAFRRAAREIARVPESELRFLADNGRLQGPPRRRRQDRGRDRRGARGRDARVPAEAARARARTRAPTAGEALRAQLKGDLHVHSDWSDGGDTIRAMAEKARALGHEYFALTDHSPRLKIAHGLDRRAAARATRRRRRAERGARSRSASSPASRSTSSKTARSTSRRSCSRASTSSSASVHSKLRMESAAMTRRMVAAIASPHVDVLGHCTGRLLVGRGPAAVGVRRRRRDRGVPGVRHRARGQLPARTARPAAARSCARRSTPA